MDAGQTTDHPGQVAETSSSPDAAPSSRPALPSAPPPLNALTGRLNNLPAPPTPFVGRERELQALTHMLAEARLLTITGAGGSGKTRLSIEAARGLQHVFAGGVCFVGLAPLAAADLVGLAVARAVGLEETGRSTLESLTAFLRERELLLLLDNFEHLLPAAPFLADLLAACPRLAVLVTSRAVLHLSAEQVYPLAPLEVPVAGRQPLERLARSEAVQLFMTRARAASPGFALSAGNASAVVEICRRLDGLPLALELAAARMRLLPPQALLARLGHGLAVLTGGARDLPARQQTLRDTIAWSHDLLTQAEQRLFRRLAVFAGGCSLEAAEAVGAESADILAHLHPEANRRAEPAEGHPMPDTLDLLGSLVDKSLLRQEETPEGEARFGMLATIREFAREQLDASGEAAAIAEWHARYYLDLAGALRGKPRWLERLDRDMDNLRGALAWCAEAPERTEVALRWTIALQRFFVSRGYGSEGRSWFERLLEHGPRIPAPLMANVLTSIGYLASTHGDEATARDYLERALALWRGLPADVDMTTCLRSLARVAFNAGELARARSLAQEDLALAARFGENVEQGLARHILGGIHLRKGDLDGARAQFEQGLALGRWETPPPSVPHLLLSLGRVVELQGDIDRAAALYEEGLAIVRQTGFLSAVPRGLAGLARVATLRGDGAAALARAEEGRALEGRMRAAVENGDDLSLLALLKLHAGDRDAALGSYEARLAAEPEAGDTRALARSILSLAAASRARSAVTVEQSAAATILHLAEAEAVEGRARRAARLLAAARVVRNRAERPWSDAERSEFARVSEVLGGLLDGEDPAAAAGGTETLTLTRAVDLALQALPSSASVPAPIATGAGSPPALTEAHVAFPDGLTARELELVRLIAAGMSNVQIADALVLSARTVERHIENIYGKLGVHGRPARAAVAVYAARRGLLAGNEQR